MQAAARFGFVRLLSKSAVVLNSIEAADAAVALAAGIPLAKLGRIEVRPIYSIPDPDAAP